MKRLLLFIAVAASAFARPLAVAAEELPRRSDSFTQYLNWWANWWVWFMAWLWANASPWVR